MSLAEPDQQFLMRGESARIAHLWTGSDTLCRMFSTGGMRQDRFSVHMDPGAAEICHLCRCRRNEQIADDRDGDVWLAGRRAVQVVAAEAGFAAELSKLTESPIETIFGVAAAKMLLEHYHDGFRVCRPADQERHADARALMMPQYPFLRYRMDWAFRFKCEPELLVFVECDGAEYHSTPEQIANDRAKDEAARAAGILLLRFTGSEIVGARSHCVARFKMRIAPDWRMP
jgi:very-short-patch-repair endonuclease